MAILKLKTEPENIVKKLNELKQVKYQQIKMTDGEIDDLQNEKNVLKEQIHRLEYIMENLGEIMSDIDTYAPEPPKPPNSAEQAIISNGIWTPFETAKGKG